jgi:hypothetical protein
MRLRAWLAKVFNAWGAQPNSGRKVRRQSLGALILNGFSFQEPARHLASWRRTFPKINVQTDTCGPNRPERHRRFYLAS